MKKKENKAMWSETKIKPLNDWMILSGNHKQKSNLNKTWLNLCASHVDRFELF